jgi:hypothetical protein
MNFTHFTVGWSAEKTWEFSDPKQKLPRIRVFFTTQNGLVQTTEIG